MAAVASPRDHIRMDPKDSRLSPRHERNDETGRLNDVELWKAEKRQQIMSASQRKDTFMLKALAKKLIHNSNPQQIDTVLLLHHAALHHATLDVCYDLVDFGCDCFYTDWHGDTVMHYATRGGNLKLLRYLFQRESFKCLQVQNKWHFSLLHTACAETNDERAYEILNVLEWLYIQGLSLELQDHQGRTPLIWATTRGSLPCTQWALSRGAHLGHRDHSGRTAIHMSAYAGDEDVSILLAQAGAVHLLNEKTIDGPDFRAPSLASRRGHYFLGLEMQIWKMMYAITGRVVLFRNNYAWYYWIMLSINGVLGVYMGWKIYGIRPGWCYVPGILIISWICQALAWVVAFSTDPGFMKKMVIPDQAYRCSSNAKDDASKRPLVKVAKTSSVYRLQTIERQMMQSAIRLIAVNLQEKRNPGKYTTHIGSLLDTIQKLRDQTFELQTKVAKERQLECNPHYTSAVLAGVSKKVCLTCRTIKGFRAHHCSDCGHCVYKFDHHCIWVDNCIGGGNQRSFLFFLWNLITCIFAYWATLAIFTFVVGSEGEAVLASREDRRYDPLSILKNPMWYLCCASAAFNVLWVTFVSYLLFRTSKSMCTNVTFYEGLRKPQHVQRRYHGRTSNCLWEFQDLGFRRITRNIMYFLVGSSAHDIQDYELEYKEVKELESGKLLGPVRV